ncbi:MAG: YdcF family protein, partial [Rubrivivax sp.]
MSSGGRSAAGPAMRSPSTTTASRQGWKCACSICTGRPSASLASATPRPAIQPGSARVTINSASVNSADSAAITQRAVRRGEREAVITAGALLLSAKMTVVSLSFDYASFKALALMAALPPVPMLILAAWGGWRLKKHRRGGGWLLAFGLALVWLSTTEGAGELLSRAIGQPAALSPEKLASLRGQRDGVVLVLGGGVRRQAPEYQVGVPNEITAERLAYGVWAARRSGWPLAYTGGIGWSARTLQQSEASIVSRVAAQDYGLPLRWAEAKSRDTRENAANTLPLLARDGVKQIVLVTHEPHMRRALRAFEAEAAPLGIRILPAPVGLRIDGLSAFDDWCPSSTGFARVRYLVYETLGWWAGRGRVARPPWGSAGICRRAPGAQGIAPEVMP